MAKNSTKRLIEVLKSQVAQLIEDPMISEDGNPVPLGPKDLAALITCILQVGKFEREEEKLAQEQAESSGASAESPIAVYFPRMG